MQLIVVLTTEILYCTCQKVNKAAFCLASERSFPTHRSLMGDSPEAIEGQAKLFRVLIAYAKYNPQVGYSQGKTDDCL